MVSSNPSHAEALLPVAREAFVFLCDLTESGNVPLYGLESSQECINLLLCRVLQESLNILRHEDETVSIEQLGGRKAVLRLVNLGHATAALPEEVWPTLELLVSQQIQQQQSRGRPARTIPCRKEDT